MQRATISFPWPWSPRDTRDILDYLFAVTSISFLGFSLIEELLPGLIRTTFDPNHILYLAIPLGLLSALWPAVAQARDRDASPTRRWGFVLALGLLAVAIVWAKTHRLHLTGAILSLTTGLIVAGVAWQLLSPETKTADAEIHG